MKRLIISLSLVLLPAMAFCGQRSIEQMKALAKEAIIGGTAARGAVMQPGVLRQCAQLTVLGYETGGFAVITNDDFFEPVIAYSDTEFSADNMPPAMQWWLEAADKTLGAMLAEGRRPKPGGAVRSSGLPTEVAAMMTTLWDQGTPFNNVVAEELGDNYLTGCVATGMAQIMNYHEYPATGQGSHTSSTPVNGVHPSVTFEGVEYRWGDMLDRYTYLSGRPVNNPTAIEAVATLMYHCGVSVNMNYSTQASGSYVYNAATAVEDYFRYSAKLYTRSIYTEDQWLDLVYNELGAYRPLLYAGVDDEYGGHAFVLDGYDANGLVHVNWGWTGSGNGYFDIALLDPRSYSFASGQEMLAMHTGDDEPIPYSSQWGIAFTQYYDQWGNIVDVDGNFEVTVSGRQIVATATNLFNHDARPFSGDIAMLAMPEEGGEPIELSVGKASNVAHAAGYRTYTFRAFYSSLADGVYRVYLASKSEREDDWQQVHSNETIANNYIVTKTDGDITVEAGEPGWTTGIANVTAGAGNGDAAVRVYTVDGRQVYSAPSGTFDVDDIPARGLLIIKRGNTARKIVK